MAYETLAEESSGVMGPAPNVPQKSAHMSQTHVPRVVQGCSLDVVGWLLSAGLAPPHGFAFDDHDLHHHAILVCTTAGLQTLAWVLKDGCRTMVHGSNRLPGSDLRDPFWDGMLRRQPCKFLESLR